MRIAFASFPLLGALVVGACSYDWTLPNDDAASSTGSGTTSSGGTGAGGNGGGSGGTGTSGAPSAEDPCVDPRELAAHYKADDVPSATSLLDTWTDTGPGGHHLVAQGVPPTVVQGALNGHAVVRFDKEILVGSLPIDAFGANVGIIVIAVAMVHQDAAAQLDARARVDYVLWQYGEPAANADGLATTFGDFGNGTGIDFRAWYLTPSRPPALATYAAHLPWVPVVHAAPAILTSIREGDALRLRRNGAVVAESSMGLRTSIEQQVDVWTVGGMGNGLSTWSGDLAELVVYRGTAVDAGIAIKDIEVCLGQRYGITLL